MFKGLMTAVKESNTNFVFENDEKRLEVKLIGLVLSEVEYRKNNVSDGTRLYVANIRSMEKIRKGDFIVPPKKLLQESGSAGENGFYPTKDVEDDDVPF